MGGPIGGYFSDASKKSATTEGGVVTGLSSPGGPGAAVLGGFLGSKGISILDPLQLGPALFDKPDIPKPKPAPAPVDETKILFREMARTQTDQALRARRTSRKPGGAY